MSVSGLLSEMPTLVHIDFLAKTSLNISPRNLLTVINRGETLTCTSFATAPGGKGANQAAACGKLSRARPSSSAAASSSDATATAHVSMVGTVGDDTYGSVLLASLAGHGVDVSGVEARGGLKTGVAMIIVDEPTGQNRIVLSPEANHALQPAELGSRPLSARLGGRPDLLVMQLEIPLATVLAALAAARRERVPVLLNPAPAQKLPEEAFEGLAHLVVNETEAAILSEREVEELDTEEGMERVAKIFVAKGVDTVIITLGGRGVYYMSQKAGAKGLIPAEKVKEVVDTTAAGDTFIGQYALGVVASPGTFVIEAVVRKANYAAARTVERKGAQDSIPWRDELQ